MRPLKPQQVKSYFKNYVGSFSFLSRNVSINTSDVYKVRDSVHKIHEGIDLKSHIRQHPSEIAKPNIVIDEEIVSYIYSSTPTTCSFRAHVDGILGHLADGKKVKVVCKNPSEKAFEEMRYV